MVRGGDRRTVLTVARVVVVRVAVRKEVVLVIRVVVKC